MFCGASAWENGVQVLLRCDQNRCIACKCSPEARLLPSFLLCSAHHYSLLLNREPADELLHIAVWHLL